MLRNLVTSTAAMQGSVRAFGTKVKFKPIEARSVMRARESTDHTFFYTQLKSTESQLRGELKDVRTELMGEIGKVRTEMQAGFAVLGEKIEATAAESRIFIERSATESRALIEKSAAEGRALIRETAAEGRSFSYRLLASAGAGFTVFVGYQQLEEHKREDKLGRMEAFMFKKYSAKKVSNAVPPSLVPAGAEALTPGK